MGWGWEGTGVGGDNSSVGHIIAALKVGSDWQIVQSSFPDPHGMEGKNSLITQPSVLSNQLEHGRLPDAAFLVSVKDLGAYARGAIQDMKTPLWNWDPWTRRTTNCTVGVERALAAGGHKVWNMADPLGVHTPKPAAQFGIRDDEGRDETECLARIKGSVLALPVCR